MIFQWFFKVYSPVLIIHIFQLETFYLYFSMVLEGLVVILYCILCLMEVFWVFLGFQKRLKMTFTGVSSNHGITRIGIQSNFSKTGRHLER